MLEAFLLGAFVGFAADGVGFFLGAAIAITPCGWGQSMAQRKPRPKRPAVRRCRLRVVVRAVHAGET